MGVEQKIVVKQPKMDGENNGKPYFLMDDLGQNHLIFGNTNFYAKKKQRPTVTDSNVLMAKRCEEFCKFLQQKTF